MKLEKIDIRNFLGAKTIQVDATQAVQLFVGPNAAGKSSIRDAVALALTADLGRVSLKKEAGQLVREGAKSATCDVATVDGDVFAVTITDSGKITDSRSGVKDDPVLPYVLDAQRTTQQFGVQHGVVDADRRCPGPHLAANLNHLLFVVHGDKVADAS